MALADFYGLITLYKWRHPHRPSSLMRPDYLFPPPNPSLRHRNPNVTSLILCPILHLPRPWVIIYAPAAGKKCGSSRKFKCADYDAFIREDLNERVLVDFEVFMKNVLHVLDGWKSKWGLAIQVVREDPGFKTHHDKYCELCNEFDLQEESLYRPFMEAKNSALRVLSQSEIGGITPEIPQHCHANDPKKLRGGVINKSNLPPDFGILHKDREPPQACSLHWANPLRVLEIKPFGNAVSDGAGVLMQIILLLRSFW